MQIKNEEGERYAHIERLSKDKERERPRPYQWSL